MPGVFKLSCSTPFTPFLRLVSVYRLFHLYFIPKTLHDTSVFSYFLAADHSPVFIYNTALLYIVLLALCGVCVGLVCVCVCMCGRVHGNL